MENPKKRFFKGHSQDSKSRNQTPRESPRSSFDQSLPSPAVASSSRPRNFNSSTTNYHGSPTSGSSANSMSFDEILNSQRRHNLMGAPRRAKSAERFDGLRILSNTSPTTGRRVPQNNLSRNTSLASPRANSGSQQLPIAPPSYAASTRSSGYEPLPIRGGGSKANMNNIPLATSPPPPYSPGISEFRGHGPPSYHQALAVAAAMASGHSGKFHPARTLASSRRNVRSFDNEFNNASGGSYSSGGGPLPTSNTMRPTVSVPAFTDDVICTCSKCQLLLHSKYQAPHPDYNNDAVYMESQAFLMNEIMTDGMAFCSIV